MMSPPLTVSPALCAPRFGEAVEDAKTAGMYPVEKGKLSWEHLNEIAEEFKVDHDIA